MKEVYIVFEQEDERLPNFREGSNILYGSYAGIPKPTFCYKEVKLFGTLEEAMDYIEFFQGKCNRNFRLKKYYYKKCFIED